MQPGSTQCAYNNPGNSTFPVGAVETDGWCREQTEPKRVVSLVCDTGGKYLTKVFNDMWVADQGMLDRPMTGTIADLISSRYGEGGVVTIAPTDTLLTAYNRMRSSDVSPPAATTASSRILMLTSLSLQSTPAELSIASV